MKTTVKLGIIILCTNFAIMLASSYFLDTLKFTFIYRIILFAWLVGIIPILIGVIWDKKIYHLGAASTIVSLALYFLIHAGVRSFPGPML